MAFLVRNSLETAIQSVLRDDEVRCAVAFWGRGAEKRFRNIAQQRIKIICNLNARGTDPRTIAELKARGAQVRQNAYLHAKVYLGVHRAVVASANVSANGLGFEDTELALWIEAGFDTTDTDEIQSWFESLWNDSAVITEDDIAAAELQRTFERVNKPTLGTFSDFSIGNGEIPLLFYHQNVGSKWEARPESIRRQIGYYNERVKNRFERSLYITDPTKEREFAIPGAWVFCWTATAQGLPDMRRELWWQQLGEIVINSWHYKGETQPRHAVLEAERPGSPPFRIEGDPNLKMALRDVLRRPEYKDFRESPEGPWFAMIQLRLRQFWDDLKTRYTELAR